MSEHEQKIHERLRRLAADFIQKHSSGKALITVTDVETDRNLRQATIFVTIMPAASEPEALNFLKRARGGFREHVKENARLKTIPTFDFEIDAGEKNRQRIDELSQNT